MISGKLTSVLNATWADEEQTMIDCNITISQFGDEVLPFTASKNDVELHGRQIFDLIVSGEYGDIAEYVPPPVLETTATPSSGDLPTAIL